jgi:hypothetical protein
MAYDDENEAWKGAALVDYWFGVGIVKSNELAPLRPQTSMRNVGSAATVCRTLKDSRAACRDWL